MYITRVTTKSVISHIFTYHNNYLHAIFSMHTIVIYTVSTTYVPVECKLHCLLNEGIRRYPHFLYLPFSKCIKLKVTHIQIINDPERDIVSKR